MREHHLPTVAACAAFCLTSSSALAQAGGFAPGELVLLSPSLTDTTSTGDGILRIDPQTGHCTVLLELVSAPGNRDAIAYDPFRDRLMFCGRVVGATTRAYSVDAAGNVQDLELGDRALAGFAPATQGRVYFRDAQSNFVAPLRYLDASDAEHVVMDSTGAQPFLMPSTSVDIQCIEYDAPSNSLIVASTSGAAFACSGGGSVQINVHKLPLSADGSRVVGPVECAQFAVNPNGGNRPVGMARMPNGDFVITIDDNSNSPQPRIAELDPATMTLAVYAVTDYAGAAATGAGTWSTVRGDAVILDTGNNVLRAFVSGSSGAGTVIPTDATISSSGSSGEVASLIEVAVGACGTNNVSLYCTAKTTSGGCVPAITTQGGPSMSAPSGFTVRASQLEPTKPGLFFYGLQGPLGAPFQGGHLCVKPPIERTAVQSSGGGGACGGELAFDFNAWVAGGNDPAIGSGTTVHGQFWFRDPASASTTGLSGGVKFSMCP